MCKDRSLIELKAWMLYPSVHDTGTWSPIINVSIEKGQNYWVREKNNRAVYWLVKALLLQYTPNQGTYWFNGLKVENSSYEQVLNCRRQIGFLSHDAALINNKTLRENILLQRQYFYNDLSLVLDKKITRICSLFNLKNCLDLRPDMLSGKEIYHGIFVREILKNPKLLILIYPEETMGEGYWKCLQMAVRLIQQEGLTIMLITERHNWAEELDCEILQI
jgi:ABC-type ATPase involved in cell division